jgi:hypothetical protein
MRPIVAWDHRVLSLAAASEEAEQVVATSPGRGESGRRLVKPILAGDP